SEDRWENLASRPVLKRYSAYTANYAAEREGRFLDLMAQEAPNDLRDQVLNCGERVRDQTAEPVLAAYGALAEVDDQRGLLLSFAFSDSPAGHLTDYMVWAWPLGTCSTRLEYTTGELDE
ncbi:MAG: hypothetical protein M3174_04735, partial [Actinomycetota bacterium]|nr:hypothetical protein [Actinomycetota bacterium]